MKYLLLLLSFFLFISCQNSKEEKQLNSSNFKNINEIVATIIIEDSLEVKKILLCDSLKRTAIYVNPKYNKDQEFPPPPPEPRSVSINSIIKAKINGERFFESKDSSHILSQYSDIEKIKISNELLSKVHSTSSTKEIAKRKKRIESRFYEIGIPLFSKDNKKAYVELRTFCGRLCGNGQALFLEKINGKWKIIQRFETWTS